MTKKHNILYCFDEIYNHQGYSSIISLLDDLSLARTNGTVEVLFYAVLCFCQYKETVETKAL